MATLKILVVDDHTLFRRGIIDVLSAQQDLEVVGEAIDGLEAIQKAGETKPDVILMGLNMPHCSGLEATQAIRTQMPRINILVLTVSDRESDLFAAIKFGARGYILKNTEPEALVHAIFHIARGGAIISPLMANTLLTEFQDLGIQVTDDTTRESDTRLSPRETDVLKLVARGATNREIADSLFISENTVKTHLSNIMEKLHLANRSQAAAYAVRRGLVHYKEP